jgi:hypothetical protein
MTRISSVVQRPSETSRALVVDDSAPTPSERQPGMIMLHLHRDGGWICTTRTIADTMTSEAPSIQEHGETEH